MYAYCLNDPVNRVDPDGFSSIELPWIAETAIKAGVGIGALGLAATPVGFVAGGIALTGLVAYEMYQVNQRHRTQQLTTQAQWRMHQWAQTEYAINANAVREALNLMNAASTASPPPPNRQTQVSSRTLYNKNRIRLDVENPNPANRLGQIHVQTGGRKYIYNIQTQRFHIGTSSGPLAPNNIQQLLTNPEFVRALGQGLRILGF